MAKKNISTSGLDLIKTLEGLRLHAYLCSAGVPTIGYGTTRYKGSPIRLGMVWNKKQAEDALLEDLFEFEQCVNNRVKVDINQKMFDSLVSFVYNVGQGNFKNSQLLKLLNQGKYEESAEEFDKWRLARGKVIKGLIRRRQKEKEMFLSGLYELQSEGGSHEEE